MAVTMTQIFNSYGDFLDRADKTLNGVSIHFAETNTDWERDNDSNTGCWNCFCCNDCNGCFCCNGCNGCSRSFYCNGCFCCNGCNGCSRSFYCTDCYGCTDCTDCSDCSGCTHCTHCTDCTGCTHCTHCTDCTDCTGCTHCTDCSRCNDCYDTTKNNVLNVPVLSNIHTLVFAAVTENPEALEMSRWHTCNTTHCRAGWVVFLAGEAGKALESATSTSHAAMMIYKASSTIRVSPTRFHESNEVAMADIKRCAELEVKSTQN